METAPVARTDDDYMATQERKLRFLQQLSDAEGGCPILCAGDIFHSWKASPWLCSWAYLNLPRPLISIPGNHDLPHHSMRQYHRSALALLETVSNSRDSGESLIVLKGESVVIDNMRILGVPHGQLRDLPDRFSRRQSQRTILMLHEMVCPRENGLQASAGGLIASELLQRLEDSFDLILTGDNHSRFTLQTERSVLVNPGSIVRMTAADVDHVPCCYLYYAESNEIIPVEIPVEHGVVSREHIDRQQQHDQRLAAYIERMNMGWDTTLSFRANLQAYFEQNRTPRKVRELVWQHLPDGS